MSGSLARRIRGKLLEVLAHGVEHRLARCHHVVADLLLLLERVALGRVATEVRSEVRHVLGLGEFVHLRFVHRSVLSSMSVQIRSRSWVPSMEEFMEEKSRKERFLVKRSGAPKYSTHHYLPVETMCFWSECERPLRGQNHSHSMVPMGLGVRSIATRQMPGTSARMRSVMRFIRAHSSSGTVAVIASTVLTARMMAGHS